MMCCGIWSVDRSVTLFDQHIPQMLCPKTTLFNSFNTEASTSFRKESGNKEIQVRAHIHDSVSCSDWGMTTVDLNIGEILHGFNVHGCLPQSWCRRHCQVVRWVVKIESHSKSVGTWGDFTACFVFLHLRKHKLPKPWNTATYVEMGWVRHLSCPCVNKPGQGP